MHSDQVMAAGPDGGPTTRHSPLTTQQWGMIAFLISEAAFFSTLIVAYLTLLGRDTVGPTPAQALSLSLVIFTTAILLSSSGAIHLAERALRVGSQAKFLLWWSITIVLGIGFLVGTAFEWRELITKHHLTISRNLFGSGYYTVVGFHAFHVTAGVIAMLTVLALGLRGRVTAEHRTGAEMVAWYWHFVDVVWIVVFTVIYVVGR